MRWLDTLRQSITLLVLLRRIAKSLERANQLHEFELSIRHPAQYKAWSGASTSTPTVSNARLDHIEQADINAWNERYKQDHPDDIDVEREYDID